MNRFRLLIVIAIIFVIGGIAVSKVFAADFPAAPNPAKLVNDYAGMLSATEEQNLEKKVRDYASETSDQIAIVTINNIGNYSIEDYAQRLARSWGIGQKNVDNGILILVVKDAKGIDIEVGKRMEASVTDYDALHTITEQIVPSFNKNQYYTGLTNGVTKLISLIRQNPYK